MIRWNIQHPSQPGKRLTVSGPRADEVDQFRTLMCKASPKFARLVGAF